MLADDPVTTVERTRGALIMRGDPNAPKPIPVRRDPVVMAVESAAYIVTMRLDDAATYKASGALPQNVNYAVKGNLVRDFLEKVPALAGKLKRPCETKDQDRASAAAERAAALVIAE